MKRIKNYKQLFESKESVEYLCNRYGIENWTLNEDGSIDVDGNVKLNNINNLNRMPIKFGRVTGHFYCSLSNLTSLEGSPNWVGGSFRCQWNRLTSLEGGPNWVGGDFDCSLNALTDLVGGPSFVGDAFCCSENKLTNLEGCPEKIYGNLICEGNKIKSLDFYPTILTGKLFTWNNPIGEIWVNVFNHKQDNHGHYLHLFDLHGPIRFEGGEWVCYREFLDNFFEEIGVPSPEELENYREV